MENLLGVRLPLVLQHDGVYLSTYYVGRFFLHTGADCGIGTYLYGFIAFHL